MSARRAAAFGGRGPEGARLRALYTLLLRARCRLSCFAVVARLREPRYRRHVAERFGRYRASPKGAHLAARRIVGEARAAAPLWGLKQALPGHTSS